MVENLIAEGIGILVSAVLFTWIGGALARKWARESFDKRWREYRLTLAEQVLQNRETVFDRIQLLAVELSAVVGKPLSDLSLRDLEEVRLARASLTRAFDRLDGFLLSNHFALRESDIAWAQKLVSEVVRVRSIVMDRTALRFDNFEGMLALHLNGSASLGDLLPPQLSSISKHDYWRGVGAALATELRGCKSEITPIAISLSEALRRS